MKNRKPKPVRPTPPREGHRGPELLWGTTERPTRGPKPGMSLERIVETAIAIAGEQGLSQLSMRRVAERLGFTTMSLYRYVRASRVERYEHLLAQKFSLTQSQVALIALLMLRGPQTAHELLARSERMANFPSIDEVRDNLDLLIGRKPALVQLIERGPGQREERYAQLLGGPVQVAASLAPVRPAVREEADIEARVAALEEKVAELTEKLKALSGASEAARG